MSNDAVDRLRTALEGRYAIERELGEGGMATVYLADDVKHERKVALKVLKPELAAVVGAERFLAEIKTTANLQHPHILPLFDSGEADSFLFYVMPYVEGETLRDRIERERQLPIDAAVRIAAAVANALHHAHERGVIHRDIKPANILMQDGEPMVADFGIALAVGAAGGSRLTETGLSVGTPFYMSPEQATGDQIVGPQSDTYALGCVLFEMLVGQPPYLGSTAQAVLGKIIQGLPVSARVERASTPANVDAAVRKALEKLPADRFVNAQAFAAALADPGFRHGEAAEAASAAASTAWKPAAVLAGTLSLVLASALVWTSTRPAPPKPVERFTVSPDFILDPPALLPDGSGMVVHPLGRDGTTRQLWLRLWSDLAPRPIPSSAAGLMSLHTASVSPDGEEVAYVGGNGELRIADLGTGALRVVADPVFCCPRWNTDGFVYFTGLDRGIDRVAPTGGAVESVIRRTEGDGAYSEFLVFEGRDIGVFEVQSAESRIEAVRLSTGERKTLAVGMRPFLAPGGELVFASLDGDLLAASLDFETLEFADAPLTLLDSVAVNAVPAAIYALSPSGTLLYQRGGRSTSLAELIWVTRSGEPTPVDPEWVVDLGGSLNFGWRLSPDGSRIALTIVTEGNEDVWVKTVASGTLSRITFDPGRDILPRWRPGGDFLSFTSDRGDEGLHIRAKRADGVGESEQVYALGREVTLGAWSPDGEWLVLRAAGRAGFIGARDVFAVRPDEDGTPSPLLADPEYLEQAPAVSPDGRWLAYSSNETGREEVFVRPFPNVQEGKWQVSTEGGLRPLWSPDGRELFFVNRETRELLSADIDTTSGFAVTATNVLFTIPLDYLISANGDFYDISPDGGRFLMGRRVATDESAPQLVLVQDWYEEVKERLGG